MDRIIILRINTEEMQIETLLNKPLDAAKALMGKTTSNGKVSISLSKLINTPKQRNDIPVVRTAESSPYKIQELENGTIEVYKDSALISPAKPILRELAARLDISIVNGNGNLHNTRQLGSLLIKVINSR